MSKNNEKRCEEIAQKFRQDYAEEMKRSLVSFLGNVKLGKHIAEGKALLGHGKFERWVTECLLISKEQARLLRLTYVNANKAEAFFHEDEREGARLRMLGPRALLVAIGVMKSTVGRVVDADEDEDETVSASANELEDSDPSDDAEGDGDADGHKEEKTTLSSKESLFKEVDGSGEFDQVEREALKKLEADCVSEAIALVSAWAQDKSRVPLKRFRANARRAGKTSIQMLLETEIKPRRRSNFLRALVRAEEKASHD